MFSHLPNAIECALSAASWHAAKAICAVFWQKSVWANATGPTAASAATIDFRAVWINNFAMEWESGFTVSLRSNSGTEPRSGSDLGRAEARPSAEDGPARLPLQGDPVTVRRLVGGRKRNGSDAGRHEDLRSRHRRRGPIAPRVLPRNCLPIA